MPEEKVAAEKAVSAEKPVSAENSVSPAAQLFGDFAPALVGFTDEVLFGQVWTRPELSPRDRSMITVASLVTSGATTQLVSHLALAKRNGVTEQELIEEITQLAFYAGWPKAMSAMAVAKQVFGSAATAD
jgi:4-carboxymuconolactone decarboxylase